MSRASQPDKKIVLRSTNGNAEYVVKNIRSIRFSNTDLFLRFVDGSYEKWASDAVTGICFEDYEPSVETAVDIVSIKDISITGGTLVLESSVPVRYSLCTVEGQVLVSDLFNGSISVPLMRYPSGIYILNVDGRTYKIINR